MKTLMLTSAEARKMKSDIPLRYVLSAGRNGTVFLANLINNHIPGAHAVHEPRETRYQMMLANLRNDWDVGGALLQRVFEASRRARIAKGGDAYVEINPFLCPMTDLVPDSDHPLHVVHMVRDPADWARSITTFKASKRFRAVIDYVPFGKPYPPVRPPGWQAISEYEKALWRWNWCNDRILEIRDQCVSYALVRYEDLFSTEPSLRNTAIATIFDTLSLPMPAGVTEDEMTRPANPSPQTGVTGDPELARNVCGDLARRLGYAY